MTDVLESWSVLAETNGTANVNGYVTVTETLHPIAVAGFAAQSDVVAHVVVTPTLAGSSSGTTDCTKVFTVAVVAGQLASRQRAPRTIAQRAPICAAAPIVW